jgi:hypothetical protein
LSRASVNRETQDVSEAVSWNLESFQEIVRRLQPGAAGGAQNEADRLQALRQLRCMLSAADAPIQVR